MKDEAGIAFTFLRTRKRNAHVAFFFPSRIQMKKLPTTTGQCERPVWQSALGWQCGTCKALLLGREEDELALCKHRV